MLRPAGSEVARMIADAWTCCDTVSDARITGARAGGDRIPSWSPSIAVAQVHSLTMPLFSQPVTASSSRGSGSALSSRKTGHGSRANQRSCLARLRPENSASS